MTEDQPARPRETPAAAAARALGEPLVGGGFRIEIDGVADAAALEVVFPEARIAGPPAERAVRYGPLTLRRALTGSPDWYLWWDRARRSQPGDAGRVVRVTLADRSRIDVAAWTFSNAEPTAYGLSPLNALAGAPLVETLELSVGGFDAVFELSSIATPGTGR